MSASTIQLDGRTLEGGGQLVRNALALSALTGQAVSIHDIRGDREGKKGLKRSHLAAVQLLAEVTESEVTGAELGSLSLHLSPQKKHCVADGVETATLKHLRQKLKHLPPSTFNSRDSAEPSEPTLPALHPHRSTHLHRVQTRPRRALRNEQRRNRRERRQGPQIYRNTHCSKSSSKDASMGSLRNYTRQTQRGTGSLV